MAIISTLSCIHLPFSIKEKHSLPDQRSKGPHLPLLLTTLHTLLTRSPGAAVQETLTTSAGKQERFCPTGSMNFQKLPCHSGHLSPEMLLKSRQSCSHST